MYISRCSICHIDFSKDAICYKIWLSKTVISPICVKLNRMMKQFIQFSSQISRISFDTNIPWNDNLKRSRLNSWYHLFFLLINGPAVWSLASHLSVCIPKKYLITDLLNNHCEVQNVNNIPIKRLKIRHFLLLEWWNLTCPILRYFIFYQDDIQFTEQLITIASKKAILKPVTYLMMTGLSRRSRTFNDSESVEKQCCLMLKQRFCFT